MTYIYNLDNTFTTLSKKHNRKLNNMMIIFGCEYKKYLSIMSLSDDFQISQISEIPLSVEYVLQERRIQIS